MASLGSQGPIPLPGVIGAGVSPLTDRRRFPPFPRPVQTERKPVNESKTISRLPILTRPSSADRTGTGRASDMASSPARRLPSWLRRQVPAGNANHFTSTLLDELNLETVCENAKCPNRMECYSQKTATFMILGNVCTRACGFCAVSRGTPQHLEIDEPDRIAEATVRLGLKHVVITSVTRDDLSDGGAQHFHDCIAAIRRRSDATIEVLTPDFIDCKRSLDTVIAAKPEVFNHNTETVPRLYARVRGPKSDYRWTLEMLHRIKRAEPSIKTKSGLMLGLGETRSELLETLADLLDVGCDFLTLGQYLQPAMERLLPVVRYVPPDEFSDLERIAKGMGFKEVASGPFVRSSYHAREMVDAVAERSVNRPS